MIYFIHTWYNIFPYLKLKARLGNPFWVNMAPGSQLHPSEAGAFKRPSLESRKKVQMKYLLMVFYFY